VNFLRFWTAVLDELITPLWRFLTLGGVLSCFVTAILNQPEWWQAYGAPSIAYGLILGFGNWCLRSIFKEKHRDVHPR
jgi:hypothetical protein